tara:strand:+ start:5284 stop:6225 length:942 start_codon:yes stop_codon:yes gene_type:complete
LPYGINRPYTYNTQTEGQRQILSMTLNIGWKYDTVRLYKKQTKYDNYEWKTDIWDRHKVFHNLMPRLDWKTFELLDKVWDRVFPDNIPPEIIFKIVNSLSMWDLRRLFPKLVMNLQIKLIKMPDRFKLGDLGCGMDFTEEYKAITDYAFYQSIPADKRDDWNWLKANSPFKTYALAQINNRRNTKKLSTLKNGSNFIETVIKKLQEYLGEWFNFIEFIGNPKYICEYGMLRPYGGHWSFPDEEFQFPRCSRKWDRITRFKSIIGFLEEADKTDLAEFCEDNEIIYESRGVEKKKYPKGFTKKKYINWIIKNLE